MAVWNAPEIAASQRIADVHRKVTGHAPHHAADAPGTFVVAGENADHFGGITIVGLTGLRVAVGISPRNDSTVRVHGDFAGVLRTSEVGTDQIAQIGDSEQPVRGSEETGLALRFGGLIHTLVGRQMLSRDTSGMDITVVSDVPLGTGLGALHAADVALGLALLSDDPEIDSAPLRTRLAEIATHSAKAYSAIPVLRARHSAALRGAGESVSVADYADGSLTQAPHPTRSGVRILSVVASSGTPFVDEEHTVAEGRAFIEDAATNFGVNSLRQLPDAQQRVVEWVDARHQVHGADSAPSVEAARGWVAFGEAETALAAAAAKALRSMRPEEFFALLGQPTRTPGIPVPSQLVQLLELRGARVARPAAAGMSQAVLAYIPEESAVEVIADLAADGLSVVAITPGDVAGVLS